MPEIIISLEIFRWSSFETPTTPPGLARAVEALRWIDLLGRRILMMSPSRREFLLDTAISTQPTLAAPQIHWLSILVNAISSVISHWPPDLDLSLNADWLLDRK
jgi:hypothetical protein